MRVGCTVGEEVNVMELAHCRNIQASQNKELYVFSPSSSLRDSAVAPVSAATSCQLRLASRIAFGVGLPRRNLALCARWRLVEVARVELASETESAKLLRVYPAFSLGRSKRTSALSPDHPFGSAPCSTRAESPAAWPDKLSLPAHLTSAVRLRGLKRRRDSNRCSQLQFFLVFYVANENPRRAI